MSDPEILPSRPGDLPYENPAEATEDASGTEIAVPEPEPAPVVLDIPSAESIPAGPYIVPPPPLPRLIPNLGHTVIFFVLTMLMLLAADVIASVAAGPLHLVHGTKPRDLARTLNSEPGFIVFTEGLAYLLTVVLSALIFRAWWKRPFGKGVHWNTAVAIRRSPWLVTGGILLGVLITFAGNFLPMPKSPPIMQDMMHSAAGAWMMLGFGVTVAPLFEELAFRGFLLPSLINIFVWLSRRHLLPQAAARWIGIPIAVAITSIGFAGMHAGQLSHAWAPVMLIGVVSVVLCTVRLILDSAAASAVVHASYNFMLFASILIQTGGFRHLEKLNG